MTTFGNGDYKEYIRETMESFVEIEPLNEDDFLKLRETLTRIGIANTKEKKMWPSCFVFHKAGRYYIVHFKEMYALDGRITNFDDTDKARRNMIASMLQDWGMLKLVNPDSVKEPAGHPGMFKVIKHCEKSEWTIQQKYMIGGNK